MLYERQLTYMKTKILKAALTIASTVMCLLFVAGAATARAADMPLLSGYLQTLFDVDSGLPSNNVTTIMQTSDGYIWLGGYNGLIRFDGTQFRTVADIDTEGFGSSSIRALVEDKNGVLWIGTNDMGLFTYKNGKFTHIESDGLFSDSVRTLKLAADGSVLVGSTKGCARITEGRTETLCDELSGISAVSMALTPGGSLWVVADSGKIFQMFGSGIVFSAESSQFSEYSCLSVFAVSDSSVLLGTNGEVLISLDTSDSSYEASVIKTEGISGVEKICRDSSERLWLCSGSGIAVFENGKASRQNALMSVVCVDFCEDYEGNLWFASTRQGVLRLVPSKFVDAGLENCVVNATCVRDSLLYAATDTGLVIMDINNGCAKVENELTKLLDGIRLRCVIRDSQNRLWLCAYEKYGAICYDGNGWTIFNKSAGFISDRARVAMEMRDGSMAIGTGDGLAVISGSEITQTYTSENGLENAVILSMEQDADGVLWIGTDGAGIYKVMSDGELENLNVKAGLAADIILRMHYDERKGVMWVSTGSRLCCVKSDGGIVTVTGLGNGSSSVLDILTTADEKLWVLTASNVIITDAESLLNEKIPEKRILGRSEGLRSTITSNSWNALDGDKLYICCSNGISIADTVSVPVNSVTPKIAVSSIIVDGKSYDPSERIMLGRDSDRLVIEYSLLSFTGQQGKISYILEGYDSSTTTVTNLQSTSYTNLGGGIYNFRIFGENGDGIRSGDIIIRISKEYSWYEIPYVWIALFIIIVVTVIFAVSKYLEHQTRAMTERHAELKNITEQAMTAISSTIDAKDAYTIGHSRRVAKYSREIAQRMGLSEDEQDEIYFSGLLHDIGKIGVPDEILTKPDKLTAEEFEIIKKHSEKGGDILKSITTMPMISEGARYHHEKFDGTGYNHGLKGDEIPLVGRIICAADTFDAMYSDRPYRKAKTRGEIAAEFIRCSGTQFEPHIADIVINMINDGFEAE